jgi:tetratricopeptide (TPR) repeat protein
VVGRNGDYELAEEVAREVLKLAPDNPLAHLLKGLALASQHKLKAARRSWDKAEQIARQTNNRGVLMAVEEVRFMYDPDHGPPLDFLRRIMGTTFFDDEDEFDDDEEWFYE